MVIRAMIAILLISHMDFNGIWTTILIVTVCAFSIYDDIMDNEKN